MITSGLFPNGVTRSRCRRAAGDHVSAVANGTSDANSGAGVSGGTRARDKFLANLSAARETVLVFSGVANAERVRTARLVGHRRTINCERAAVIKDARGCTPPGHCLPAGERER